MPPIQALRQAAGRPASRGGPSPRPAGC